MKIRILGNDSEIGKELKRIRRQLTDPSEALREIDHIILDEIARCFKTGRAPDGTPWKRSHRAERDNRLTLVDRGILRSSFSMRVLTASVDIGTADRRAPTHQFGLREDASGAVVVRVPGHEIIVPTHVGVNPHRLHGGVR